MNKTQTLNNNVNNLGKVVFLLFKVLTKVDKILNEVFSH